MKNFEKHMYYFAKFDSNKKIVKKSFLTIRGVFLTLKFTVNTNLSTFLFVFSY